MRTEKDPLGSRKIPKEALYGIHAARSRENFPDRTPFHEEWYRAVGLVKLACYRTYRKFKAALLEEHDPAKLATPLIDDERVEALTASAAEVSQGKHFEHFIVPAISGGGGTSINMNVNEIIANASLVRMGKNPGEYDIIDPITHANIFQSTNDVIPTALKIAVMKLMRELEDAINGLRRECERLESEHRDTLRIAYTQMQAAVPSSFGKLFGTYSEMLSRDWWRVSKVHERIKVVNLGGSAVGTAVAVPRFVVFEAVSELAGLTGLPLARSENLPDATANLDSIVEAHAILKAHAANLEKMSSDLRLLASDIGGAGQIELPNRQVGSSIMPGKINPVMSEFVISCAHKIYANDSLISELVGQGVLDLNPYLPVIGHAFLESVKLMIACDRALAEYVMKGVSVRAEAALDSLYKSPSTATALIPYIGYHEAWRVAEQMKSEGQTIFEACSSLGLMDEGRLRAVLKPAALLRLGFSVQDVIQEES